MAITRRDPHGDAGSAERPGGSLPPIALATGDAVALVVWALVGVISHDHTVSFVALSRNAGPILAGWFAAALVLRTYAPRVRRWRLVAAWAIGISAGVVLRAVILGRSWNADEFQFLGVTLAVTFVFLAAWRAIDWAVRRWSPRRSPVD